MTERQKCAAVQVTATGGGIFLGWLFSRYLVPKELIDEGQGKITMTAELVDKAPRPEYTGAVDLWFQQEILRRYPSARNIRQKTHYNQAGAGEMYVYSWEV